MESPNQNGAKSFDAMLLREGIDDAKTLEDVIAALSMGNIENNPRLATELPLQHMLKLLNDLNETIKSGDTNFSGHYLEALPEDKYGIKSKVYEILNPIPKQILPDRL